MVPEPAAAQPDPAREALVLTKATLRAAENLAVSSKALAEIIGVSQASISRSKNGERPIGEGVGKERELALLFLRLYRSLDSVLGGNLDMCREWLRADNAHLGGVPSRLIKTVTGLTHVVEYLDAMRGKT
jgi:transcriptional regulator with XRE-family HTH domain